jgi:hypothetical protein
MRRYTNCQVISFTHIVMGRKFKKKEELKNRKTNSKCSAFDIVKLMYL